jgi:hypothetical protein
MLKEVDNLLFLITGQLQPEYLVLIPEIERVFMKLKACTSHFPYIMHLENPFSTGPVASLGENVQ